MTRTIHSLTYIASFIAITLIVAFLIIPLVLLRGTCQFWSEIFDKPARALTALCEKIAGRS